MSSAIISSMIAFSCKQRGFCQSSSAKRAALWAEFVREQVIAAGTIPQKKHLLRQMVKKVLIHDRRTIEIWYGLPNQT
ncbi:MAG TPA: hypothetical protein VHM71_06725 [Candidatus Deferrimicrobium sp.]|nr:hypothetical protein [Candidatus Deferrimicrobium sp.]